MSKEQGMPPMVTTPAPGPVVSGQMMCNYNVAPVMTGMQQTLTQMNQMCAEMHRMMDEMHRNMNMMNMNNNNHTCG